MEKAAAIIPSVDRMTDFNLKTYKRLIRNLPAERTITVSRYFLARPEPVLILRHDVDAIPENALIFAKIQHEIGMLCTFYFRMKTGFNKTEIMDQIARMGHEIGYHYEDVATAFKAMKKRGKPVDEEYLIEKAFESFQQNLALFRTRFEVKTICRHGSPLCPFDDRIMWKKYSYGTLGILGDAGLDIHSGGMYYLTDTGRRWDGDRYSMRDRIPNAERLSCRTTFDILRMIEENRFPDKIMMTFHPQRWNDDPFRWTGEWVSQTIKNAVKYCVVRRIRTDTPRECAKIRGAE